MQQLRRGFEVDVTVSYSDDHGEPAPVEGDPVWTSSDPAALAVVNTADPFAVTIQALGAIGAVVDLTVEADADLGSGVVPVTAAEQVQIVSGQATTAGFSFGEPREIAA